MSVKIVFHGQSNIEIHSGNHRIQVDPFYDQNPTSDVKAKDVNPEFIFLTHAHGDHVADAEAIYSYEGTREMNTLIVGRSLTGLSAFV